MPEIHVLRKEVSELIAAGEVIERPASVVKELVENAIDAGASHITVEIKRGGTTYMRIVDDGCGMAAEDVSTAFLRHATSKITEKSDLTQIHTLGFRGEALASVAAVSKVTVLTKRKQDAYGTSFSIAASVPGEVLQSGCPDGTTILIRDLFYNVPVRQKFMKRDTTEANAVSMIVQKIALSHPQIAFQMIRDNRMEFRTDGTGDLFSAIYAVCGKEFAHDMVPVSYDDGAVRVSGFAGKPLYAKSNRTFQNFFVNGRYVRSRVCSVALESAYQNLIMTGKFPSCVLLLEVDPEGVDVNVHPAKAEVRFSNEKQVTDAMYFAIKNALLQNGLIYEFEIKEPKVDWTAPLQAPEPVYTQPAFTEQAASAPLQQIQQPEPKPTPTPDRHERAIPVPDLSQLQEPEETVPYAVSSASEPIAAASQQAVKASDSINMEQMEAKFLAAVASAEMPAVQTPVVSEPKAADLQDAVDAASVGTASSESVPIPEEPAAEEEPLPKVIGEAFENYILAETADQLVIFDKHAAHERVIFERLKSGRAKEYQQLLLSKGNTMLAMEEFDALERNQPLLEQMGFAFDFSHPPYAQATAVPSFLKEWNLDDVVIELAHNLAIGKVDPKPHDIDDLLHTIACKSAIKAHDRNDRTELQALVNEVYRNPAIRHCPHGRPVMFVIKKYELEKQFKRV